MANAFNIFDNQYDRFQVSGFRITMASELYLKAVFPDT